MIYRQDYMDGKATFREYYGQFVTDEVKSWVLRHFTKDQLRHSTDYHMNDLPLSVWLRIIPQPVPYSIDQKLAAANDYATQAVLVCIAKEAARQIVDDIVVESARQQN